MITSEELSILKTNQQEILRLLNELHIKGPGRIPVKDITAKDLWQQSEFVALNLINWWQRIVSGLSKRKEKFMCHLLKWSGTL